MPSERKVTYCATHNTFPEPGEPCWSCANKYIKEAFDEGFLRGLNKSISLLEKERTSKQKELRG